MSTNLRPNAFRDLKALSREAWHKRDEARLALETELRNAMPECFRNAFGDGVIKNLISQGSITRMLRIQDGPAYGYGTMEELRSLLETWKTSWECAVRLQMWEENNRIEVTFTAL